MSKYKIRQLNKKENIIVGFNSDIGIEKCVYKLTFPDNSIYIGIATENLWDRIQNHTTHIRQSTRKDEAIRKFRTFNVDVLHICQSEEQLKTLERIELINHAQAIFTSVYGISNYYIKDLVKPYLLNDKNY